MIILHSKDFKSGSIEISGKGLNLKAGADGSLKTSTRERSLWRGGWDVANAKFQFHKKFTCGSLSRSESQLHPFDGRTLLEKRDLRGPTQTLNLITYSEYQGIPPALSEAHGPLCDVLPVSRPTTSK
ncbi:predicted protein [Histoplasma capsulatum var. duboisii H88]|uniref:Predicted protein n=2 Tax=Ajellomyces capsulatus TaxID=5037 RepID=F0ULS5_AJEC8|nr:predicted protein [Histoplasma capsulatum H143]EGC48023.1 predicted protein [Histoplasma capsulatum var. duboisii H88]